jgi:hypothetical protein
MAAGKPVKAQVDSQLEAEDQALRLGKDCAQAGALCGGGLGKAAVDEAVAVAGLTAAKVRGGYSNRIFRRGGLPARLGRFEGGQTGRELGGVRYGIGRVEPCRGSAQPGRGAHDAAGGKNGGAAAQAIGLVCGAGEEGALGLQQDGELRQDAGVERRFVLSPVSAARLQRKNLSLRGLAGRAAKPVAGNGERILDRDGEAAARGQAK